jgi:hypothetical protein
MSVSPDADRQSAKAKQKKHCRLGHCSGDRWGERHRLLISSGEQILW